MVKLRNFSFFDLDRVTEIRRISLPDSWPKSRFEKMYGRYPKNFIVAENKDEVIGYIIGGIKKDFGRIISLAVDPRWRKRGTGKKLINFLTNQFEKKV